MFEKGTIKDTGIDITIKNNPDHFLSPNDWGMVQKARFGKISPDEYKTWYLNLIRERWTTRREEFMALAEEGLKNPVKLLCYCPKTSAFCHARIASDFMNALVKKLNVK
jgi:hypothetical protein